MRISAVFRERDDRLKRRIAVRQLPERRVDFLFQLFFTLACLDQLAHPRHNLIIVQRSLTHPGLFHRILDAADAVDEIAVHHFQIRAQRHQADQKARGPELVDPNLTV